MRKQAIIVFFVAVLAMARWADAAEKAVPPHRIVSLSPAATEILLAIGAHAELVGVTRYCVLPSEDEKHVTRVGGVLDPDYERIASLHPDLVVVPLLADKALQERLLSLGITVVVLHPEGLLGILDDIRLLGRATGRDKAGEAVASAIEATRAIVTERLRDLPVEKLPRVLLRMDEESPAPGSYVDDLLTLAHGRNALPRGPNAWVKVSPESVLQLNPDIIVEIPLPDQLATALMQTTRPDLTLPGHARIITLSDSAAFYHPGPGVGKALWSLARALYPQRFPEPTPPAPR